MISPALLRELAPFHDAPGVVTDILADHGMEVRYRTNAVVFAAGSAPRGWYIVIEGKVRVVRGTGARQHVIHNEGPGGTLGEVPLFAGGMHPATGIAAEPTRCALFTLPALRAAMASDDAVALILLRRLALRVRGLVDRLDDRSGHSVRERLAVHVAARAAVAQRGVFTLGMTQKDLAEELGTVREVVSRELRATLAENAMTSIGGGRYRLPARVGRQNLPR